MRLAHVFENRVTPTDLAKAALQNCDWGGDFVEQLAAVFNVSAGRMFEATMSNDFLTAMARHLKSVMEPEGFSGFRIRLGVRNLGIGSCGAQMICFKPNHQGSYSLNFPHHFGVSGPRAKYHANHQYAGSDYGIDGQLQLWWDVPPKYGTYDSWAQFLKTLKKYGKDRTGHTFQDLL